MTLFGFELEKLTLSPALGGIIALLAGAGCIFACFRPTMYEYRGKLVCIAIFLILFSIIQFLFAVPAFTQWVAGFVPV
ncbi:MAG: hypothetical protein IJZ68_05615 [Bacteroidaceae bacterium]|nr:hypothetical protein [Bacteroidaceae bacterium]